MEQEPNRQPNYERLDQLDQLLLEQGFDLSDLQNRGVSRINIWEGMFKNNDGKAETVPQMGVELRPSVPPHDLRAEAVDITPTRAKKKKKNYRDILVFSDPQIGYRRVLSYETGEEKLVPLHDEAKIHTAHMLAKEIQPNTLINLSDTVDLAEMSKFAPDSDQLYRTLQPSFQRVYNMYARFRADLPDSRFIEVSSNHNERFNKEVMKHFPHMYGVKRAGSDSKYPVLTYPYMVNLEDIDVEWFGGYPVGEHIHRTLGGIAIRFAHGTETSTKASSAATKAMRNHPETMNVQGHDHKDSEAWHTLRDGTMLGTFVIGALCKHTGEVPGYHSGIGDDGKPVRKQQNWTSSLLHIKEYEDGELDFNRIMINNDATAIYEDRVFKGQVAEEGEVYKL